MRAIRYVVTVIAVLTLVLGASAATSTHTPAEALSKLTAQRVAAGLPGDLVLNDEWSQACAAHLRYLIANPSIWSVGDPHAEDPSLPGASEAGADAAAHSVLSRGRTGWSAAFPWSTWESAPWHLISLLRPQLAQIGYANIGDQQCLTTGYGRVAPENRLYTYPGDGTKDFYYAEATAGEGPFSPGEMLGWDRMRITGPYIYVFGDGPWVTSGPDHPLSPVSKDPLHITAASLTGPSGAVSIQTLDVTTMPADYSDYESFLYGTALIIPLQKLKPNESYHVSATLSNSRATLSRDWSFQTGNRVAYPCGFDAGEEEGSTNSTPVHNGHVVGHLTKKVFRASQARQAKLVYRFVTTNYFFGWDLWRFDGATFAHKAGWNLIHSHSLNPSKGGFRGRHTITVKKLFGGVQIKPARYKLIILGDIGRVVLRFRVR